MECVRCHAGDHWDGAVFCHRCGTRLRNRCVEETCPAEDLDNAYRFCPLCGKQTLFASLGLMEAAATLADAAATDGAGLPGESGEDAMTATDQGDEMPAEAAVDSTHDGVEAGEDEPVDLGADGIPDEALEAAGEAGATGAVEEAVAAEIPVGSGAEEGVAHAG